MFNFIATAAQNNDVSATIVFKLSVDEFNGRLYLEGSKTGDFRNDFDGDGNVHEVLEINDLTGLVKLNVAGIKNLGLKTSTAKK